MCMKSLYDPPTDVHHTVFSCKPSDTAKFGLLFPPYNGSEWRYALHWLPHFKIWNDFCFVCEDEREMSVPVMLAIVCVSCRNLNAVRMICDQKRYASVFYTVCRNCYDTFHELIATQQCLWTRLLFLAAVCARWKINSCADTFNLRRCCGIWALNCWGTVSKR